jgi:hypothetical protein
MGNNSPAAMSPLAARIYGVAAILGPLLLLGATTAYILEGEEVNRGVLGGTISVWASFAMIIALVGVLRLLEINRPRAAPILTIFALTGFAAGIAFSMDAIFAAIVGPDLDAALDAAIDDGSGTILILAYLPWGWFAPLSLILIGIFLWRSRTTPWWTGALMIAGGVLFVVGQMERIGVIALIGDAVLLLAFAPIGWMLFRRARRPEIADGAGVATPRAPVPQ